MSADLRSLLRRWPGRGPRVSTWPRPDFLLQRRPLPMRVWAVALAGVALLGLGSRDVWVLRADLSSERARLQRLTASRTADPKSVPLRTASAPKEETLRNAERLAAQSRHPWGELFAAIESAPPAGVQWVGFEHASESTELRLEGIASDAGLALRAVDALATQPGWSSAVLTRLTAPENPGTAAGMRFEIAAQFRPVDVAEAVVPNAKTAGSLAGQRETTPAQHEDTIALPRATASAWPSIVTVPLDQRATP